MSAARRKVRTAWVTTAEGPRRTTLEYEVAGIGATALLREAGRYAITHLNSGYALSGGASLGAEQAKLACLRLAPLQLWHRMRLGEVAELYYADGGHLERIRSEVLRASQLSGARLGHALAEAEKALAAHVRQSSRVEVEGEVVSAWCDGCRQQPSMAWEEAKRGNGVPHDGCPAGHGVWRMLVADMPQGRMEQLYPGRRASSERGKARKGGAA